MPITSGGPASVVDTRRQVPAVQPSGPARFRLPVAQGLGPAFLVTWLAVVAEVVLLAVVPSSPLPTAPVALLALATLFAIVETLVVGAPNAAFPLATGLRTLILLLGVAVLAPAQVAVAHAVGGLIGASAHQRRWSWLAAATLSTAVLGTTVGGMTYEAVAAGGEGTLLRWWGASFVGAACAAAIGSVGLAIAWRGTGRTISVRTALLALTSGAAITLGTASVAMTVLIFSRTDPAELFLLLGPVAVSALAVAAYSAQRRRQEQVEFLYACSQILDGVSSGAAMLTELLEGAVSRFGADRAELVLEDVGGRAAAAAVDRQGIVEPLGAASPEAVKARLTGFDATFGPSGQRAVIRTGTTTTTVIVAIGDADRRIGMLALTRSAGRRWRRNEVSILQLVAENLAARLGSARMVEELRTSLDELGRLAALVTAADDAIVGVQRDGTIASWNRGAELLFGYPAADVIGLYGGDMRTIAGSAALSEAFGRAREGEVIRDVHADAERKDGTIVPIAVTMSPVRGDDGTVKAVSIVARDETPRALQTTLMRESLERFERVFDGSPVGIGVVGSDFRWLRVNEALCRALNLEADDIVGRRFEQFVARDDLEQAHGIVSRLLRGETEGSSIEVRLRLPQARQDDGRVMALTVRPLRSGDGALQALCTLEDITEWRRAEERSRAVEAQVHAAVLAMTAIREPDGIVTTLLSATRGILSARAAAFACASDPDLSQLVMDGDPEAVRELADGIRYASPRTARGASPGSGDATPGAAWAMDETAMLAVPLEADGAVDGVLYLLASPSSAFDEGDRAVARGLAAQAALSLQNARAHQRTLALVRELDAANAALQHASEAKSRFLANVSHELRTPLHSILLAARLLKDPGATGGERPGRTRQLPGVIEAGGAYLLGLIDDLVDLSRMELSDVRLHRTSLLLGPVFADVRQQMRPLAAEAGIRLRVASAPATPVLADPLRLRQVLVNLLSNAIKYTEPGGRVWLRCIPHGDLLAIEVGDTGVGMEGADIERAFEPFERLGREAQTGAGLGLAIARRLVELHQGTLTARSTPGVGSVFTVTLALAAEPARHLAQRAPMRPVAAARRVLVVDDDATAAELLGRLLENAGFEVLLASTIAETKDILSRVPTDALILDRRLEDGDSLSLLAERHAWVAPGTEVVTMSASTGEEQEALDAGAVAHLRKPVAVEALLDQLRAGATHVPIAAGGHR